MQNAGEKDGERERGWEGGGGKDSEERIAEASLVEMGDAPT